MFFSRCRTGLPPILAIRVPAGRVSRWSQIRQLHRPQGRSHQPSKILPRRANQSPLPPPRQPDSEPQYEGNPNENGEIPGDQEFSNVKVRFLTPAIWAITVSSGIYISLAYFTAKKELEPRDPFAIFQGDSRQSYPRFAPTGPPTPTEVVTRAWRDAGPMSKLSWGLIGVNGAVHLSGLVARRAWNHLWHIPATNRNYTLLTSTFVHSGPMHLGVNLYALYNFLPVTGYSSLFRGDSNHVLSFFLTTGIISGLAQHIASTVFKHGRPYSAFIPSGGASGALFAVFGAFCMEYPTQGVGIILIPYYLEAQYFLPMIMTFDLVGMIRGFSFVSLGHAAHLSGACLGVAYSYLDGRNKIWRPLVDFWKRRLREK